METNGNLKIIFFISIILITCGFCIPSWAGIIYVDDDATGANNGSSWYDAYNFLQDALAVASATDAIRVAQGIYKPDLGSGKTAGDRQATFQLINGVTIEGGYAGILESEPDIRNVDKFETVLSGDLSGDDGPEYENYSDNSCHVVTGSFTDQTAVLDGFTITAGNETLCDVNPDGGSGMRIEAGNPTIQNCQFIGNISPGDSVLLNYNSSNPTIINCTFSNNYRTSSGIENISSSPAVRSCIFEHNIYGMENRDNSSPAIDNCIFRNSEFFGYGMLNRDSSPTLTNCTFENNEGGGINSWRSNLTLTNCIFKDNLDSAIDQIDGSLMLVACQFSNNTARRGAGISCLSTDLTLFGCVFSENTATSSGGAIDCSSEATFHLNNCTFIRNSAGSHGGGINAMLGELKLELCNFSGNRAERGGGIYGVRDLELNHCIFDGNRADQGGSVYLLTTPTYQLFSNCTFYGNKGQNSAVYKWSSHGVLELEGCILWGNDPNPIDNAVNVTYSNVQGGWPGEGNIDIDPLFVSSGYWADANDLSIVVEPDDPDAVWVKGDYHLQSQAGHWDSQSQSWIQDEATSPCVDAGNPMSPIGLEPFPNGAIFNMGAYGRSAEASKTYFGSPVCDIIIPGDINGDCVIDFKDLEIVVLNWMLKGEDFVNSPPTVTLLEPQDGARIVWPGPTLFRAEADDPDGEVVQVRFNLEQRTENSVRSIGIIDSNKDNGWGSEYTWRNNVSYGNWTVWAEATDDKGAVGVSSKITITLIAP